MSSNPSGAIEEGGVSVIMSVYNDDVYLGEAINSILNQSFDHIEFLIVDDGSTDDSKSIISSYNDERITLLENGTNQGLTASLNLAIEACQGQFIARQDADDRSHPQRLERQVAYLEENPSVALVGSGARIIDASGEPVERRIALANPSLEHLLSKNRFVHGSVTFRGQILRNADGYDERFEQVQDYELWLRLAEEHSLRNLPDLLYDLRMHAGSVYIEHLEKSVLYYLLAKRMTRGKLASEKMKAFTRGGILNFEDVLTAEEQLEYHLELARTYLRYDQPSLARSEARKALDISDGALSAILPFTLSYLGRPRRRRILNWIRAALNGTIRVRNRFARN